MGLLRAVPRTRSPAAVTFNAVTRDSHPMLRLAAPFAIAELAWMLMGFVDTVMAGRLGPAAISKPKAVADFARCRDMWRPYPGLNCVRQVVAGKVLSCYNQRMVSTTFKDQTMQIETGGVPHQTRSRSNYPGVHHE